MNKTITKSILVLSGATLGTGTIQTYTPAQHKKASTEIISQYLAGYRQYNPQKYKNNWDKSEARKQELLSQIAGIRTQIRNKALIYARDRDTKLIGVTAIQKTAIRSEMLMTRVANLIG